MTCSGEAERRPAHETMQRGGAHATFFYAVPVASHRVLVSDLAPFIKGASLTNGATAHIARQQRWPQGAVYPAMLKPCVLSYGFKLQRNSNRSNAPQWGTGPYSTHSIVYTAITMSNRRLLWITFTRALPCP